MLAALDEVAAHHRAPVAAVALAWLSTRPRVVALASARTTDQLSELIRAQSLDLSTGEIELLDAATDGLADVQP